MSLRTFIVDDEDLARARLRMALSKHREIEIIGEAAEGETAVRQIETLRPDLVFLDVQMPGMDGFDVVRALSYQPTIVFATAHDEYALRAFEVSSLDYLLKPYGAERLDRTIERALANARGSRPAGSSPAARSFQGLRAPARLACRKRGEIYFVAPADVTWFESSGTITFVHTASDKLQIARTLDWLESQLAPAGFVRSHRAALVNLAFVRKVTPLFNGSFEMTLDHVAGAVPLSRRGARELKSRFPW